MDERQKQLSPEEIAARVRARKVKTWGGVAVGAVALVWGLIEGSIPHLLLACVAFGVVDPAELKNAPWK